MKMGVAKYTFAVLACSALCYILFLLYEDRDRYSSIPPDSRILVPANDIIGALDRYHERFGRYPDSLDDLMPDFLSTIPKPQWGTKEWTYEVANDGTFLLIVEWKKDRYERVGFYSRERRWQGDF
jgi:hypothetical protein